MKGGSRLRHPTTFAILMLLAAAASLLPGRWTRWTGNLLQPVAWVQWVVSGGTRAAIRNALTPPTGAVVPQKDYDRLEETVDELHRQIQHQQLALDDLERRFDELTGVREQLRDDSTRIVLATVVGGDTAAGREALVISPGALRGIAVDQWVVAGRPLDPDETATGRELLLRGWVIGRVADARNHVARVRLCTDPAFGPVPVWLGKLGSNGRVELAENACVLEGIGGGKMIIRQATQDYFAAGYTYVMVRFPGSVPVILTVGTVTSSRIRSDSPLHYDLDVAPAGNARALTHVYVLNPRAAG